MKNTFYLSDTLDSFEPQKSLSDFPTTFENSLCRGCVFYLSHDGRLGGDSFIIKSDHTLTISLLADMTNHGELGRSNISPFLFDLSNIAEIKYEREDKTLKNALISLDSKLNIEKPMSLSFLRILPNGKLNYLNVGENMLLLKKHQEIIDRSEYPGGKMGFYSNLFQTTNEDMHSLFNPKEENLNSGDRIILFTDGVLEYTRILEYQTKALNHIKKTFSSSKNIEDCLMDVNQSAKSILQELKIEINDDYTFICFEIK